MDRSSEARGRSPREWDVGGWFACRASDVPADGAEVSSAGLDTAGWLPAVVPGTVLGTLVANGQAPDPYFGMNATQIPDASDPGGVDLYTYWFRAVVEAPPLPPGGRLWLDFRGINYSADVWVDGTRLNPAPLKGMFLRHSFDVTGLVATQPGPHVLAVRVVPPDPPGNPGGNGGEQGTPNIGENVTMRYGVGWDWVIPIPDRSTGIWDRVTMRVTGPVRIRDPHVVTKVLDDAGSPLGHATLRVSADLENASGQTVQAMLHATIGGLSAQVAAILAPGECATVAFPESVIENPRLWWPNGYGAPELYDLELAVVAGGAVSDAETVRVGIRQVTTGETTVAGGRTTRFFLVNGERIFVRGGNWIGTDAMLRLSSRRYCDEVRMHREAGLNLIRVWGGGIAERPEFYAACDENGILVMQDFWISGEFAGPFPADWQPTFLACARDTILMLRSHPSLLFWSGGNEQEPPAAVLAQLQAWIEGPGDDVLDGTRILVPLSTNISGTSHNQYEDGPYGIVPLGWFFPPPSQPFNPELGSIGAPVAESIRAMMTPADADGFPQCETWPAPPTWTQHKYIPYFNDKGPIVPDQVCTYGTPGDLDQFAVRTQLTNYAQYRAMFEGFTAGMWTRFAGFMLWKSQNPWPGLRGSLYDWELDQNGGLFGVRTATEPVHVQQDAATGRVQVVNASREDANGLTAAATVYLLDGTASAARSAQLSVPAGGVADAFPIAPPATDGAYFLALALTDGSGATVSRNFYWLTTAADFTSLQGMPAAGVDASARGTVEGDRALVRVSLCNGTPGAPVAFFLRLQVRAADGAERVLPVFYTDNYLSLVPGETRQVTLDFAAGALAHGAPALWLEGWNVERVRVPVTWDVAVPLPPLAEPAPA